MTPLTDLDVLLRDMRPVLDPRVYAYAALPEAARGWPEYAIACFEEDEGRSMIALRDELLSQGLTPRFTCRRITLAVLSALEAVGLTARIAQALAQAGISANVVAALHHDHVFVPDGQADEALAVLLALSERARD